MSRNALRFPPTRPRTLTATRSQIPPPRRSIWVTNISLKCQDRSALQFAQSSKNPECSHRTLYRARLSARPQAGPLDGRKGRARSWHADGNHSPPGGRAEGLRRVVARRRQMPGKCASEHFKRRLSRPLQVRLVSFVSNAFRNLTAGSGVVDGEFCTRRSDRLLGRSPVATHSSS